jgi:hypothetical protein
MHLKHIRYVFIAALGGVSLLGLGGPSLSQTSTMQRQAEAACQAAIAAGTTEAFAEFRRMYRGARTLCNARASTATVEASGGDGGSVSVTQVGGGQAQASSNGGTSGNGANGGNGGNGFIAGHDGTFGHLGGLGGFGHGQVGGLGGFGGFGHGGISGSVSVDVGGLGQVSVDVGQ